jgi:site-specific recombinase XerD
VVVLWRAGLRVSEALALTESDFDASRGAILVRRGKGGKRREVGMDRWPGNNFRRGSEHEHHFRWARCSCAARTDARTRVLGSCRAQLRRVAVQAGVRRRFAPHQLRHAHAVELSREGVPLVVIQRQLGHADLGITSAYLRGIDGTEIIHAVHERPAPMIPATNGLFTMT